MPLKAMGYAPQLEGCWISRDILLSLVIRYIALLGNKIMLSQFIRLGIPGSDVCRRP